MSKLNIKTGDNVLVIAGKDKGKVSVVKATSPKDAKVIVEGVNIQSRHTKARRANEKSSIVKKEGAIDASNVMIVCPACNKATRVAKKEEGDKMIRVCKKCGASLEVEKKVKATKKETKKEKTAEVAEKPAKKTTKATSTTKKAPAKTAAPKKTAAKATTKKVATQGDK